MHKRRARRIDFVGEVADLQIHVVAPGQSLYAIGQEYGVSPGLIARYNGLREPYRLAVGQSLLILRPQAVYTVRAGDTLTSVSERFSVPILELLRNNPNLSGPSALYPGQTIVLRLESDRSREVEVNGYAYPNVDISVLRGILPFTTWLTPFTYGFTANGTLIAPNDAPLVSLARQYGVGALLHLSTLTEDGSFSTARAQEAFASFETMRTLAQNTARQMVAGGYGGVDVDFEFLGAELAQEYAQFVQILRQEVNNAGGILITALAPKNSDTQRGILYEGHDYAALGENSDALLLMSYEWGYTYGPPMAVAPIRQVEQVVQYALSRVPAEKLLLGFPNYAYDWTIPYKPGVTRAELFGNEAAVRRAIAVGAEIQFDEDAQTPFYSYTASDGSVHEVWFEDARSALAKYRLISQYNLRGVGFWNFMRPFTAGFSLLNYLFTIARIGN